MESQARGAHGSALLASACAQSLNLILLSIVRHDVQFSCSLLRKSGEPLPYLDGAVATALLRDWS